MNAMPASPIGTSSIFGDADGAGVWSRCLDAAIEAFNSGSLGIAAAVVDPGMAIVSLGRNRMDEIPDDPLSISGSSVSHAETNAIHGLGRRSLGDYELSLYTTVEPCPMCVGAIGMSRIRRVVAASRDPHAGSLDLLESSGYLRSKGITTEEPGGAIERVFFGIHYLSIKRLPHIAPDHRIFAAFRTRYGGLMEEIDDRLGTVPLATLRLTYEAIDRLFGP